MWELISKVDSQRTLSLGFMPLTSALLCWIWAGPGTHFINRMCKKWCCTSALTNPLGGLVVFTFVLLCFWEHDTDVMWEVQKTFLEWPCEEPVIHAGEDALRLHEEERGQFSQGPNQASSWLYLYKMFPVRQEEKIALLSPNNPQSCGIQYQDYFLSFLVLLLHSHS